MNKNIINYNYFVESQSLHLHKVTGTYTSQKKSECKIFLPYVFSEPLFYGSSFLTLPPDH